jgi:hypothetical protein
VRAVIGEEFDVGEAAEVDTLGSYLVMRAGHVPVRGELVPGPATFGRKCSADPRESSAMVQANPPPRRDRDLPRRCGRKCARPPRRRGQTFSNAPPP